jgi:hypothetical protein
MTREEKKLVQQQTAIFPPPYFVHRMKMQATSRKMSTTKMVMQALEAFWEANPVKAEAEAQS